MWQSIRQPPSFDRGGQRSATALSRHEAGTDGPGCGVKADVLVIAKLRFALPTLRPNGFGGGTLQRRRSLAEPVMTLNLATVWVTAARRGVANLVHGRIRHPALRGPMPGPRHVKLRRAFERGDPQLLLHRVTKSESGSFRRDTSASGDAGTQSRAREVDEGPQLLRHHGPPRVDEIDRQGRWAIIDKQRDCTHGRLSAY